jgi:hypothetical protein
LRLTLGALGVGFPLGFIILFFVRLQSPTGFQQPRGAYPKSVSIDELRTEISTYETLVRRAIRIELGACLVVGACFSAFAIWLPASLIGKIGCGLVAASAVFIAWFLMRYARVREIPKNIGFADTMAAYRGDLQRRYRLSRTFTWWYVLPLSLGVIVMIVGLQLQKPGGLAGALFATAIIVIVGGSLTLMQRAAGAGLKLRIEQLEDSSEKLPYGASGAAAS